MKMRDEDESSIQVKNRRQRSRILDSERGKKNQEEVDESDKFQLEKNQITDELKKNLRTRETHDDRKHIITMRVKISALIPY
uniref:Uncharacterized protein n=1 Tax=Brassica campestris TaxID=3711 RepID=M4F346_BRACM